MQYPALIGFVLSIAFSAASVRANVKLPALFSDHMVLQADASVPVFDWAARETVTSSPGSAQSKPAKAGADGRWMVKLDPMPASGEPRDMLITSANPKSEIRNLKCRDVLVGEVWLGSGQSNMALSVEAVKNAPEEIAAAKFPALRMFRVNSDGAATAQEDCKGSWQVCSPATARLYSATAYFFGRELHQTLGVPVGLISSSVGGTRIESWISLEAQERSPELKSSVEAQAKAEREYNVAAARANFEKTLAKWKQTAAQAKAEGTAVP